MCPERGLCGVCPRGVSAACARVGSLRRVPERGLSGVCPRGVSAAFAGRGWRLPHWVEACAMGGDRARDPEAGRCPADVLTAQKDVLTAQNDGKKRRR